MTDKASGSVLVIEDVEDIRQRYIRGLKRAGFDVDGAGSREEAMQWIERKTFDVALVDLNLLDSRGDVVDRSGLDIIRHIKELDEGTRCLVVSAQKDIDSGLGAFRAGMDDFIKKAEIRADYDVVNAVRRLMENVVIKPAGPYKDLIGYLSRPDERTSWETNHMSFLKVDAKKFFDLINISFSKILPILRPKNTSDALRRNEDNSELRGLFWSKKLACACDVCFSRTALAKGGDGLILEREKYGVHIRVAKVGSIDRRKFEDRIVLR